MVTCILLLVMDTYPKWGLLLGSRFFSFKSRPPLKRSEEGRGSCNNNNGRVASPESIHIYLKGISNQQALNLPVCVVIDHSSLWIHAGCFLSNSKGVSKYEFEIHSCHRIGAMIIPLLVLI